jgi:hypothetical protein
MKATKRLIDSVWTIEYEILESGEAEILRYSRDDVEGYEKEKELPLGHIVEDEQRTAVMLILSPYKPFQYLADATDFQAKTYMIANQKHIFSYR